MRNRRLPSLPSLAHCGGGAKRRVRRDDESSGRQAIYGQGFYAAAFTRLQFDRADALDLEYFEGIDALGREQLRTEVADLLCGGAAVAQCSL